MTIDNYGMCLISEIDSGNCSFSVDLEYKGKILHLYLLIHFGCPNLGVNSLCRWSTNVSDPSIFVKYRDRFLDIIDTEKELLMLTKPIQLEKDVVSSVLYA